ncbi:unnamed protein product [Ambrosiozyma monospora]|uniref:Unnamed protein product n=1 Tax=Ambrosiozyma monospora TaxID=43982 RepID=A0ACB5T0T2_AMBMO|nr:unnamed protein product [Ambrosiozyma monospora]
MAIVPKPDKKVDVKNEGSSKEKSRKPEDVKKDVNIAKKNTDVENKTIKVDKSDTSATTSAKSNTPLSNSYQPAIDPQDLLTLEVIADEVTGDEEDIHVDDHENWEFEDDEDEDEDDDYDPLHDRIVPHNAQTLFWNKIMENRKKTSGANAEAGADLDVKIDPSATTIKIDKVVRHVTSTEEPLDGDKDDSEDVVDTTPKKRKSVSFAETVDVKEVENIWDDLRKSEFENERNRVSQFMMARHAQRHPVRESHTDKIFSIAKELNEEEGVVNDIIERPATAVTAQEKSDFPIHPVPIIPQSNTKVLPKLKFEGSSSVEDNLVKISKSPKTSRFKAARLAHSLPTSLKSNVINQKHKTVHTSPTMTGSSTSHPNNKSESLRSPKVGWETDTKMPAPMNPFHKSQFGSLKLPTPGSGSPRRRAHGRSNSKANVIFTPKDINPELEHPEYHDEDYEIVRNEQFDEDDDQDENNHLVEDVLVEGDEEEDDDSTGFSAVGDVKEKEPVAQSVSVQKKNLVKKNVLPKTPSKTAASATAANDASSTSRDSAVAGDIKESVNPSKPLEVVDTHLDYTSLNDDMDTMAKAYVLGLYDDDIETEGQVIEELRDFEEHNQTVEARAKQQSQQPPSNDPNSNTTDGDDNEEEDDNGPVMTDEIVERDPTASNENANEDDPSELSQLDIELSDEALGASVGLDYLKMRSKMIYKYKGSFNEHHNHSEFEPKESVEKPRMSRFKSARLGISDDGKLLG